MKKIQEIPRCENCTSRAGSIFCNLKQPELQELSANKGCNFYAKGQTLFVEGSRPTGIYCIYAGKLKVYKIRDDGKTQIVRFAKKGDILGYRALISGELYTATATVMEDTTACYIPGHVFLQLLRGSSEFSLKVMDLFARELWQAEEKITSMAMKPVRERVAEALLLLKDFYGLKEDHATLDVKVTREEIAGIAGTSTETVVRALTEFKKEKLISENKKAIKFLEMKRLHKIAHLYD